MQKEEVFGKVKRKMTLSTLLAVMMFLLVFVVFLCVSFVNIINQDYVEKEKKFSMQTLSDIELRLIRTESIVDEAINQYNILKSNPSEENFYHWSYLISVIRNSLFMDAGCVPEVVIYDGEGIRASAVDVIHNAKAEYLAEIEDFLDANADTILQKLENKEFYYTCTEKGILGIRGGLTGLENGFLVVMVPSEFLIASPYGSGNYFLENMNVYGVFDGTEVIKIDSSICLLPEEDVAALATSGEERPAPRNILTTSKDLETYDFTLISYQKVPSSFLWDGIALILLLLVVIGAMILCKIFLGKLVHSIVQPMEELYEQMNEYAGDEGIKHD